MTLVDEIREGFASITSNGARLINEMPAEYPAFVIRIPDGYGVAIQVEQDLEVSEKFNSCRFHTQLIAMDNSAENYLILSSAFEEYRYQFAALCAEFVNPGINGEKRRELLENPYKWWLKWKELVGNTNREQKVYNVIAEMLAINYKLQSDSSTEWAATRMGSHDIECSDESCEVKSTLKRYGAEITISGQHQLEHFKRLFLYFCRMEESLEGVSINEMKEILVEAGYDEGKLEIELERQGFERGASIRNKKYKVLEKRKYEVDDSFPRITKEAFKGDRYADAIIHIEYTVDLDGIEYTTW